MTNPEIEEFGSRDQTSQRLSAARNLHGDGAKIARQNSNCRAGGSTIVTSLFILPFHMLIS
jgi:hypothetical protein